MKIAALLAAVKSGLATAETIATAAKAPELASLFGGPVGAAAVAGVEALDKFAKTALDEADAANVTLTSDDRATLESLRTQLRAKGDELSAWIAAH